MENKKPLLVSISILLIVGVLGIALAVTRPKPAAVKTQKPIAAISPTIAVSSPAAERKYKVVSSVKGYEVKVVKDTLEEYLTKMGVFKQNGLYDPVSKKQVTAEKILLILIDKERVGDESVIMNGVKIGKASAAFSATDKTMNYYVYLGPEQYKKTVEQLSLAFSQTLSSVFAKTIVPAGDLSIKPKEGFKEIFNYFYLQKIIK